MRHCRSISYYTGYGRFKGAFSGNGMQMETFSIHSEVSVWPFLVAELFVTAGDSVKIWKDIQWDKRSGVFAPNNTVAQQTHGSYRWSRGPLMLN